MGIEEPTNFVTYSHCHGFSWHLPDGVTEADRAIVEYAVTAYGYLLGRTEYLNVRLPLTEFAKLIRAGFDNDRASICADVLESMGAVRC